MKNFRKIWVYGTLTAFCTTLSIGAFIGARYDEAVTNLYVKMTTPTEYARAASTSTETVIVNDFDRQVEEEMASDNGTEMLKAWAQERVAQRIKLQMQTIEEAAAKKASSLE